MRGEELRRAKQDLATIKGAAGLKLPFGWDDVWWTLAIGLSSLIGMVWALAPHGMGKAWGLVPVGILALYYMVRMRIKYRRSTGRSPIRRRGYTSEAIAGLFVAAGTVLYVYWAKHWDIPAPHIRGGGMVMAAFVLAFLALRNRHEFLSSLGFMVIFVVAGVATALWPQAPTEVLVAGGLFIGAVVSAGVMAHFIREADVEHAAD